MRNYLQLIRPANVLTALTDVLAGYALALLLAGAEDVNMQVIFLILASMCLYAGGIVFNDIFDLALDKVERPERLLPRGIISVKSATIFGVSLFAAGIALSAFVSSLSVVLAMAIAGACLVYDKWAKHHTFLGPVVMGCCRGLNLLLGMSMLGSLCFPVSYLFFVPVVYIAAVTHISQGEVYGNNRSALRLSGLLYLLIIGVISYLAYIYGQVLSGLFILAFAIMIFSPLLKALKKPEPTQIKKAVKAGVLGLIWMNAAWVSLAGFFILALCIVLLLPICLWLGKRFAVT